MHETFDIRTIPEAVVYRNGLPHVHWLPIFEHIRVTQPPDHCPARLEEAVNAWLALLADHLGGHTVTGSGNVLALHPTSQPARRFIDSAEEHLPQVRLERRLIEIIPATGAFDEASSHPARLRLLLFQAGGAGRR